MHLATSFRPSVCSDVSQLSAAQIAGCFNDDLVLLVLTVPVGSAVAVLVLRGWRGDKFLPAAGRCSWGVPAERPGPERALLRDGHQGAPGACCGGGWGGGGQGAPVSPPTKGDSEGCGNSGLCVKSSPSGFAGHCFPLLISVTLYRFLTVCCLNKRAFC